MSGEPKTRVNAATYSGTERSSSSTKSRFWFISNADISGKSACSSRLAERPSWKSRFW